MAEPDLDEPGEEGSLVLEQRFAIVPEWVIDAEISDCAYRLYSILLRYGQSSGQRMPGRATLAARLHKSSKDTVDRALKELVRAGAVVVEHRCRDGRHLTNRYHVMSTPPAARGVSPGDDGRTSAATHRSGRNGAATPGRTAAARVAAHMRPDRVVPTENPPPPSAPPTTRAGQDGGAGLAPGDSALLAACGIANLDQLARECQRLRRGLGKPQARWSADRLLEVLREAVSVRGWPAPLAARALRTLAADPATLGPMRLPCPGPWWDAAEQPHHEPLTDPALIAEQEALEARLSEAGGSRVWAQQQARARLAERGEPITRLAVARLACQLLDEAELTPC
jgi:hypothetical protein